MPSDVPWGRTARRVEWAHVPPQVRHEVERRIGAPVVSASSQSSGHTPGFASVLSDATGARHFVKAAASRAQRPIAEALRQEARVLSGIPTSVPAPALLWTCEVADWVLLSTEYVDGGAPRRPWRAVELEACLTLLRQLVSAPAPAGLDLGSAEAEFADWPGRWRRVGEIDPERPHLDDAVELATRYADVVRGESLVHGDVRDDNLLLGEDGQVLLCGWTWPCRGAAWLDSLFLLIAAHGDGLDAEAILAAHPLLAAVPREDVDVVLALAAGYFLERSSQPVPSTSPHLREVQRRQGEACWGWLAARRAWV